MFFLCLSIHLNMSCKSKSPKRVLLILLKCWYFRSGVHLKARCDISSPIIFSKSTLVDLTTCFPERLMMWHSSSKLSRTSLFTPIALQCLVMHFWLVTLGPSFRRTSLISLLKNSIKRSNRILCPDLNDTVLFHTRRWPSL